MKKLLFLFVIVTMIASAKAFAADIKIIIDASQAPNLTDQDGSVIIYQSNNQTSPVSPVNGNYYHLATYRGQKATVDTINSSQFSSYSFALPTHASGVSPTVLGNCQVDQFKTNGNITITVTQPSGYPAQYSTTCNYGS